MEKRREEKKASPKGTAKKAAVKKPVAEKANPKKIVVKKTSEPAAKPAPLKTSQPAVSQPIRPSPPAPAQPVRPPQTHAAPPSPPSSYWQDRYGEDRIVLMIRDPYWCFAYWDLTAERQADVITQVSGGAARIMLRVYDVTDIDFNGGNANRFDDISVTEDATNWYINVWSADRSYCVDLGLLYADGRFVMIVRSNIVTTPRDSVSPVIDEEWMVVDETFDRLYRTAGANELGRSSEAMTKFMLKSVRADVSSGGLASMGSAGGRPRSETPEDFWLVVNTELIVYGATAPDAAVTAQGKPVRLNPDGTFSLRFALPDGQQQIPIGATSANGMHKRQITPIVDKRTE